MRIGRGSGWLLWPAALLGLGTFIEEKELFEHARFALHRDPARMPSTRAVPPATLAAGQPVLSIVASEEDLRDPQRGILVQPAGRGRQWERYAYLSYFDEAKLRFATGAGLRVHGGRSRLASATKSFGVFFRRRYGPAPDAGVFFDGPRGALERVVAHNDVRHDRTGRAWHFVNPLAYDIAARIGAIVPRTRPMRFLLNGKLQGVYVLTEHIGPQFLAARFGHSDFDIVVQDDLQRAWEFEQSLAAMPIKTIARTVDTNNLTRWALSVLFCGTTDIWQGARARDRRRENSRWFWINWDMDHSFMDLYQRVDQPWKIDTYRSLLGVSEARSRLLRRLLAEDPLFRQRFASVLVEMLNHRLTPAFLQSRVEHYRIAAAAHGLQSTAFLDIIEEFFRQRPAALRSLTQKYLNLGEPLPVSIEGTAGRTLMVDGHETAAPYRGMYFPETPVRIEVPIEHRPAFAGWSVNGRPTGAHWQLTLPVRSEMSVTAQFRD